MSTDTHLGHDHAHAADHGHGHDDHGHGAPHGTLKGYLIGFILSVILTAIPFWLVMATPFGEGPRVAMVLMAFAVVQVVVHVIFFLHMSPRSEGGWTMMAMIFTLVVVAIALIGSMWVMFHLNANMMPMSMHDMRQMP